MAILGFKSKNDEVLDHWISFADGLTLPPQEFYAAVEKAMTCHKIPSMKVSQVEHAEGGLLSDKRLYLRMLRERLAFDTCAAPFGNTYFFSCRPVHSPPVLRVWHLFAVFIFLNIVCSLLGIFLWLEFSGFVFIPLFLAIVDI